MHLVVVMGPSRDFAQVEDQGVKIDWYAVILGIYEAEKRDPLLP